MNPVNSTHEALINAKNQIPLARVTIFDTCKTVPNKGPNVEFYTLPDTDSDAVINTILNAESPVWYEHSDVDTILGGEDIVEASTALAFDWGVGGSPPPIGQAHLFGIRWYGYFYARYTGVYRFYIDACSFGRLRIKFNGSYLTFKNSGDNTIDKWNADKNNTEELYADTVSLTKNNWYSIQIEFAVGRKLEEYSEPTYLCIKYREPTGATTNYNLFGNVGDDIVSDYPADTDKKILSAGVVNTTGSFLTGTEITEIVKQISGGRSRNESAQYDFTVGIAVSTWLEIATVGGEDTITVDSTEGFPDKGKLLIGESDEITFTNKTSTTFTGVSGLSGHSIHSRVTLISGKYSFNPYTKDFGIIKPFRLCKVEFGHRSSTTGTEYYSDVVWGHIFPNPNVRRSGNEDLLQVKVQDFNNLLVSILQQNYPDNASYSGAVYYNKLTSGEPDGQDRPVAYDRWNCAKAVRDLFIKANIDPILTYQRKRLQVSDTPVFESDYGGYLLDADFQLNYQPNYGNPNAVTNPDDEYLWFFGYGSRILEMLGEFAKTFGRRIGFTASGFAKFSSVGLPTTTIDVKDDEVSETGTWTDPASPDFNAIKGHYRKSTDSGTPATLSFSATGSEFKLLVGRHENFGSVKLEVKTGDSYIPVTTIYIDGEYKTNDNGIYDLDYAGIETGEPWLYYDGIYSGTGENISEVRFVEKYDYGSHIIRITVQSGANPFIDALFCYDDTLDHAVRDIATDITIDDFSAIFDIENIRNDILVVGALQGLFQNSEGQTVNPNNPIYLHIFSRALDVFSIYDSGNSHYTGRRIPFEVYDPKINSQEWADYLSTNTVKKYRPPTFQPSIVIPGDMRLEIDDCITIKDLKTKTTTDADNLWIERVQRSYTIGDDGKVKFSESIDTNPRKPVKSFERKPALNLADFNNEPIINIELKSQGKRISGNDITIDTVAGTITIDNDPEWDTNIWKGYLFVVFGTITKGASTYPVLVDKIESNTSDTITLSNLDITEHSFGEDLTWMISFNPFDTNSKGAPLEIHYDQLITGRVKIYIKDAEDRIVAIVNPATAEEIVEWGPNKIVYWSGVFEKYEEGEETNYYVNNETFLPNGDLLRPLSIVFDVEDIDNNTIYRIKSKVEKPNPQQYAGMIKNDNNFYTQMTESEASAIFPYLIDAPPILYLDDEDGSLIVNSGRVVAYNHNPNWVEIDNANNWVADIEEDSWIGKTIFFPVDLEYAHNFYKIASTSDQGGGIIRVTLDSFYTKEGPYSGTWGLGDRENFYYAVFDYEPFSKFQSKDNSFAGLKLHIEQSDIYLDGDFEYKMVGDIVKVKTAFDIVHDGVTYSFNIDDVIDFCCFSDWEHDHSGTDYRVIFWNKHNPNKLYWTWILYWTWVFKEYNDEKTTIVLSKLFNPRNGLYPFFLSNPNYKKSAIQFPKSSLTQSGIYGNILRRDFSIFDGEVHEWENTEETWFSTENYPIPDNIKNIFFNPEKADNAFMDLPQETDKDTEYMGRLFVFDTDFRDRAGRYASNNYRINRIFSQDYEHYAVYTSGRCLAINIKTDALPIVWHPLTYTETKLIAPDGGKINSLMLWGMRNILIKTFKK